MKTSHALLIAALIFLAPLVMAQIQFSDQTVQTTAGQPKLLTTIVVSPVGSAIDNGTALKTAYEDISGATADVPILVKVEPGVYDLGTGRIDLLPYVNLTGSGTESTIIQSAQDTALNGVLDFQGGDTVIEIRDLTVEHTGTGSGMGIYNESTMFLKNVHISFSGIFSNFGYGVYNDAGYLRMDGCEISTVGYSGASGAYGVVNITNACELFNTTIRIKGASATYAIAAYNISGSTKLRHCVATAQNSTSGIAVGIFSGGGLLVAGASEVAGTNDPYLPDDNPSLIGVVGCWTTDFFPIPNF